MQTAPRWLLWRLVKSKTAAKPRKVPYYADGSPRSGELDTEADRARLVTMEQALSALAQAPRKWAGIGFALGPDGTGAVWQGIDLDNTQTRPELAALIDLLPGYVEQSPSGNGVHAIGHGPEFPALGANVTGIEAYSHGRFFTVTGRGIQGDIEDLRPFIIGTLAPLHRADGTTAAAVSPAVTLPPAAVAELRSALLYLRSDDRDIWVRMGHALCGLGETGRGLWLDWSYTSEKYDTKDAARVWDSLTGDRTDYRTVFAAAQDAGWVNPRSGTARQRPPHPATDRAAPPADDSAAATDRREPYALEGGVFKLIRQIQKSNSSAEGGGNINSEVLIPLANFSAIVVEERRVDDGAEVDHRSIIRATLPRPTGPLVRDIDVPTDKFSSLAWVTTKLGHQYIVNAGTATRDHLRCCIQRFSDEIHVRDVYAHTGWRQIDGRWLYLHAGGAIGADGLDTSLSIELPEQLAHYNLPAPPPVDEARAAVRASLEQITLVDDGIGAVQLARIYAPPLCEWYRFDLGVFVTGRTGTHKSELAALAMAHYGQGFNARSLPGGWDSTDGALLLLAFRAKNALFEIDDFNPLDHAGCRADGRARAERRRHPICRHAAQRPIDREGLRCGRRQAGHHGSTTHPCRPTRLAWYRPKKRRNATRIRRQYQMGGPRRPGRLCRWG
jgi:hypothetical protein